MNVIYKITCTANGKFYIGSTVNVRQRWARHRKELRTDTHKNKNMQASWNKYGEDAFNFEIVEEVADMHMLMVVEQKHLDMFVGAPDCFNYNRFADSPWRGKSGEGTPRYGSTHTPEARAKISAAVSGEKHPNWGKTIDLAVREKIAAANKAHPHHEYRHTDDAKKRIGAASKDRPQSLATRAKRSASMMGHEVSSTTRTKISQTLSGDGNYWYGKKRPEHGEKVSKAVIAVSPDGSEHVFSSISALREGLALAPPTVNRALKSGTPLLKGPRKGWIFRYAVI